MTADEWVQRVTALKQWRRGGERAPHKPLLLLYALGRLQRTGSSSVRFADAEGDLGRLLEEFGPPRATSPGYPFHHLTTDGLWVVHTPTGIGSPGPNLRDLRAGAVGELAADFSADIEHDPRLLATVVRAILDANFPPTLHDDVLNAVGITLEPAELLDAQVQPTRRRDPAFREKVLVAYEYQCAVCGYDGQLFREAVGLEAAHVRWWAADGPDQLSNALALCSLHHKLFDRGAIGLTSEHKVAVSSHFIGRSAAAESGVLRLVDRPVLAPQAGQDRPHLDHVIWHHTQVFRSPARQRVA
jgi:putative restriction endonuclease